LLLLLLDRYSCSAKGGATALNLVVFLDMVSY
jgi:hypothetical protein